MAITLNLPGRRPALPVVADPQPVARLAAGHAFQWAGSRVDVESLLRLRADWYPRVQRYARLVGIFGAAARDTAQTIADLEWSPDDKTFGERPARTESVQWARLAECLDTLDWWRAAHQVYTVGCVHIVAWPDPDTLLRLQAVSLTELTPPISGHPDDAPVLVEFEGAQPRPLWERDTPRHLRPRVVTAYRPDGEYGRSVWTPAQALLDDFEALLLMSVAAKAFDLNRITGAGILFLPNSLAQLDLIPEGQAKTLMNSPTIRSIIDGFTKPMADPYAPERVIPAIITGPPEAGDQIKQIVWDRAGNETAFATNRDARWRNIAVALDQPAGRILNSEDQSKFYNSQAIDFFSMRSTVGLARLISNALMQDLFRPILREQWRDAKWRRRTLTPTWDHLQPEPDRTDEALRLLEAGAITLGHAQDMAKVPEAGRIEVGSPEWRELLKWRAALNPGLAAFDPAAADPLGQAVPPSDGPAPPGTSPDGAGAPDPLAGFDASLASARLAAMNRDLASLPARATSARTAAAHPLADVAAKLNEIDRDARTKIAAAAEQAMLAAMRKVGVRIANKVKATPAATATADLAHTPGLIPARLGPSVCAALLDGEADPLAHVFDDLGDQSEAILAAAFLLAMRTVGVTVESEAGAAAVARATVARTAAVGYVKDAMMETARTRIFSPATGEVRGEAVSGMVPAGIPGRAVAVAGGAELETVDGVTRLAASDVPPAGVATGQIVVDTMATLSVDPIEVTYVWRTGAPSHPFKPHHDLAGLTVTSLKDPRLASSSKDADWVGGSYRPLDHAGCQCVWDISIGPAKAGA